MNRIVIRYASRILAPKLLIQQELEIVHILISPRHCWIVVAPFRGIHHDISFVFFLPWD